VTGDYKRENAFPPHSAALALGLVEGGGAGFTGDVTCESEIQNRVCAILKYSIERGPYPLTTPMAYSNYEK
jgi:hypothetical protein